MVRFIVTYLSLFVGIGVLLAISSGVLMWAGVRVGVPPWWAVTRAVVQLALISLALRGVLAHPELVAVALVVMFAAASWTSARQLRDLPGSVSGVLVSSGVAATTTLVVAFGLGMLELQSRFVVALGGIVIGSTMTAMTLAGRGFRRAAIASRGEVEAWLAIGATPSQSVAAIGRVAAGEALRPVMDQTRTTGLVTLPGAFAGALMGGASPLEAGRFQLVVLVCLITAQSVAAVLLVRVLGRSPVLPADPTT